MPKIAAPNIEEHVRQQTEKLLDAASQLFRERGYFATDLSDIARSIGLKRNSLYRYYPNKDHILLACIQRDVAPWIAKEQTIAEAITDPYERIDALIDMQIDFAISPDHASLQLMEEIRLAAPDLKREVMAVHDDMQKVLSQTVENLTSPQGRDPKILVPLIYGMIHAAATLALTHDNVAAVKTELKQSVRHLLGQAQPVQV